MGIMKSKMVVGLLLLGAWPGVTLHASAAEGSKNEARAAKPHELVGNSVLRQGSGTVKEEDENADPANPGRENTAVVSADETKSFVNETGNNAWQPQQSEGGPASPATNQEPQRRALPAPLDGIFPSTDYLGPTPLIGVPDTDPVYPLTKAIWSVAPVLKNARIKVYGWINPGISVSTSNKSNIPESYAIVPNRVELDQGVIRIERLPDTVQTDHVDWGFRLTPIYGIDYRFTTAQGWFSGQLLNHNYLYGFDPVEAYALLYIPYVGKGMVIKAGRYISPPDIEAQLSPDNYLFTHSLMFTVDCYTQTGINASVKLNDQWSILAGIHAGDDIAPWNKAAHPTGMFMVRWVSKNNNDSLYGGIDSVNNGKFKSGHDNLQQFNLTWTHRFNETGTLLTSTEAYYIYQSQALVGGTVNNGPPRPWFTNVGAGALIPGNAPAVGVVNYTEWKFSRKDFLSLRPLDILVDKKGERTGFPTTYESWTVGVTHRFNELISVRPEVRYEYAFSARPYDNGTRRGQLMFGVDTIIRF
jgi:Putative beta-barrel porin-2, OmpL-like. bbp2